MEGLTDCWVIWREREAIPEDSHSEQRSDDKQRKLQFSVDILDNLLYKIT